LNGRERLSKAFLNKIDAAFLGPTRPGAPFRRKINPNRLRISVSITAL
jgi:hypothetical protein